jgi:hypothetical protein
MGNAIVINSDGTTEVRILPQADTLAWLLAESGCCHYTPATARVGMWLDEWTQDGPNDVATCLLHALGRPHPGVNGTVILVMRNGPDTGPLSDRDTLALLTLVDHVREALHASAQVEDRTAVGISGRDD